MAIAGRSTGAAALFHPSPLPPYWGKVDMGWQGGRIKGVELIPESEFKRPRIDILVSAFGLYRDVFPRATSFKLVTY